MRAAPTRVAPAYAARFGAWPILKMYYMPWVEMVHTSSKAQTNGPGKLRRLLLDSMFDRLTMKKEQTAGANDEAIQR